MQNTQSVELLSRLPIFSGLSSSDLKAIADVTSGRRFGPGEVIFREGDPGDTLFVIASGMVKISRLTVDGREKTLSYLGPGEFFGEMALLDQEARSATVEALEETECLALNRLDFLRLMRTHSTIGIQVVQVLSKRLRDTNTQVMDTAFRDVRGRVIRVILDLAERLGVDTDSGRRIELHLTHRELANLAGTSRETVSRIIAWLRARDSIREVGGRLVVPDQSQLRALLRDDDF